MTNAQTKRTEKQKALSALTGNGAAQSQALKPNASYSANGAGVKSCKLCGGPVETLSGVCWPCHDKAYAEWSEQCQHDLDFDLGLSEYINAKATGIGIRSCERLLRRARAMRTRAGETSGDGFEDILG